MQAIRHWLAPLLPTESAALLRELSDLESGSPRQWLLLEIAATLGPGETSRRTRLIAFLARGFGIAALLPLLERLRLPGVSLYRERAAALGRYARQAIDDAALLLASFFVGAMMGMGPLDMVNAIESGIGGTLGFLAAVIGLGTILGKMMEVSGAAERIGLALQRCRCCGNLFHQRGVLLGNAVHLGNGNPDLRNALALLLRGGGDLLHNGCHFRHVA